MPSYDAAVNKKTSRIWEVFRIFKVQSLQIATWASRKKLPTNVTNVTECGKSCLAIRYFVPICGIHALGACLILPSKSVSVTFGMSIAK
jgi:hypothetical protein